MKKKAKRIYYFYVLVRIENSKTFTLGVRIDFEDEYVITSAVCAWACQFLGLKVSVLNIFAVTKHSYDSLTTKINWV